MKIAVLGGGSFGLTLAQHLSHKHDVRVWEFLQERVDTLRKGYCPLIDLKINPEIIFSTKFQEVLPDAEVIVIAVPSEHVSKTLKSAKSYISIDSTLVLASKGFDDSKKLLSELIEDEFDNDLAVFSGPTIAKEMARGILTSANIASKDMEIAEELCLEFSSDNLKCYPCSDMIGLQVGGAYKNIIAVLAGVVDGLNAGMNTKAYLMTVGLSEMKQFGVALGAKESTFYDLSGVGDLIVTCSSANSRNRQLGEMMGKGERLDDALKKMTMIAEGVHTTKIAIEIAKIHKINVPLAFALYDIMFHNRDAKEALMKVL